MLVAVISLGGLGFVVSVVLATAYAKLAIKSREQVGMAGICNPTYGTEGKGYLTSSRQPQELPLDMEPKVAIHMCQGDNAHTYYRFKYIGIEGCLAADLMAKGPKSCTYGCLGFGDCVNVCKFDAIELGNDGLPIIDDKRCTGCGSCVKVCPRNIIVLVRKEQKIYVGCCSPESHNVTKLNCEIGCIECEACEKSCPYDAIKVENGRAWINFEHCRNCAICAFKCPTGAIVDKIKSRPKAMIGTNCTGCEKCVEVCPMRAIEGEASEQHKVIFDKCIGCALCYNVCEPQAITMAFSLGYAEV